MTLQPIRSYEFGPFSLDSCEHLLLRDGKTVPLTPKAFELLLVLVSNHGHLVGKDELIKAVWPDTFVEEGNLSWNVSHLRKILGDGENGQRYIETVPKRGYRFLAEVVENVHEGAAPAVQEQAKRDVVAKPPARHSSLTIRVVMQVARTGLLIAAALAVGLLVWWTPFRQPPQLPPPRVVPLTVSQGNEMQPSFSPDGNQIAFVWDGEKQDNPDIWVKQIGNESLLRLTTDPASDTWPSWSPDGRHIAFIRERPEAAALYLIPSLGGPERRITHLNSPKRSHYQISWSPNGEWLAFSDGGRIFLMSPERYEKRKLTSATGSDRDHTPAISPDGRTVAFFRNFDLSVVPVAGGEPRVLVSNVAYSIDPTWSPDGSEILFLSARAGGSGLGLWRVAATGGTPVQLEAAGRNLDSFAVSRVGRRLAWTQTIGDQNIWRMELGDARSPTERAKSAMPLIVTTRAESSPQISPDGNKIVFASDRSGSHEIWIADSDGERQQQLTFFNLSFTGSPHWSPDGRQIVFDSRAEGKGDIYVISVEGGKPRRLTNDPDEDVAPSWSTDGQWIYFCSTRSGSHRIWKIPAAGGGAVMLTQGDGGHESIESPDGKFLYYQRRRLVPGIWRVPVRGGDETLVLDHHRAGYWRHWTVAQQGIYFATAEDFGPTVIEFFSFATSRITEVTTLRKGFIDPWTPGLTIHPDGRWLIWSQVDHVGNDIMLMENFR